MRYRPLAQGLALALFLPSQGSVIASANETETLHLKESTDRYGGAPHSGVWATRAFNEALAAAQTRKCKTIQLGKGSYVFTSRPMDIDFGVTITGHGKGRTSLLRDYIETWSVKKGVQPNWTNSRHIDTTSIR